MEIMIIGEGFWLISQNFFHLPLLGLLALIVGAARE
jgi:hypothetical protein